jgi:hypothetical protein
MLIEKGANIDASDEVSDSTKVRRDNIKLWRSSSFIAIEDRTDGVDARLPARPQ